MESPRFSVTLTAFVSLRSFEYNRTFSLVAVSLRARTSNENVQRPFPCARKSSVRMA